ncbi:MAG TPA: hypothetical protein VKZ53_23865 [Candidatus Angelobacter sp.]|nr:hypothetical protein [Candidatus Angelobacter sp.]
MKKHFRRLGMIACLFVFLLIVIGGGLRLNPLSAVIAASTGTPLFLVVARWCSLLATPRNADGELERVARN